MKRLLLAALLPLAFAAPAHAVTLVNPEGQPIGGVWQQWANDAQVPTVSGALTLMVDDPQTPCQGAGCSQAAGDRWLAPDGTEQSDPDGPTETWISSDVPEWGLDWELGHQFDWRYLTDAQRAMFAQQWGQSVPWWDSLPTLEQGREDGLEALFAQDYADCATGEAMQISWIAQPPLSEIGQLEPTCDMIETIGAEDGADPGQTPNVQTTKPKPATRKKHTRTVGLRSAGRSIVSAAPRDIAESPTPRR